MLYTDDQLLSSDEVARLLNVKPGTLATWRCKCVGPCFLKLGRGVFYRQSAIMAWVQTREIDPAAKARAA